MHISTAFRAVAHVLPVPGGPYRIRLSDVSRVSHGINISCAGVRRLWDVPAVFG